MSIDLLQRFECIVIEVREDCVDVEMYDLTNPSNPIEFASIYLSKFDANDVKLLCEGAVFYWNIGNETKDSGQIIRYSEFVFK
jgi:hypothetical protein